MPYRLQREELGDGANRNSDDCSPKEMGGGSMADNFSEVKYEVPRNRYIVVQTLTAAGVGVCLQKTE
jgi:hypothetical protein